MSRLFCVGSSSNPPAKSGAPVKAGVLTSGESAVNKPVPSKPRPPKSQSGAQPQGERPLVISYRGQVKENTSRSEAGAVLQAPSRADVTRHGKEKLAKPSSPVCAVEQTGLEKDPPDGPVLKVARSMSAPKCPNRRNTSEEESGDDEECGEDEETAEHRAPIELLAEFLKAVMGKDYPLAKKLCQMILIYEPENPEAQHFLPLIEERMLIEEAQEETSSEDNRSDVNEESTDGDDDTSDDEDDDDDEDEDSSSCDSDEELTDSNSSSSDEMEEHSESRREPPPQL